MGTIFKLTPAGVLTTLVNFNGTSGSSPSGQLAQAPDGKFYGTTTGGGAGGLGTVFKMTPAGSLAVLASFGGSTPALLGSSPTAGVSTGPDGFLYGTTGAGGLSGAGSMFRVTSDGAVATLYSFTGRTDGRAPAEGLFTASDGFLYGPTSLGIYRINPPPAVFFAPATNVTGTGATLNGTFVPEAFSGSSHFEYGPSLAYGQRTADVSFGPGVTALASNVPVSNLQPLLTYHCRLVVNCSLGSFAGADSTFTTTSTATFSSATSVPVTVTGFNATGFSLALSLGFAPAPGTVLTLVNNTGAGPIGGVFTGLPDGGAVTATYLGQTYVFQINYAGGDGNDITLTAVSQVITFPPIPAKAVTDAAFTLGATSTSALPISYSIVAGSSAASVSGNQITLTGAAGVVTVKASQAGNGTLGPALDVLPDVHRFRGGRGLRANLREQVQRVQPRRADRRHPLGVGRQRQLAARRRHDDRPPRARADRHRNQLEKRQRRRPARGRGADRRHALGVGAEQQRPGWRQQHDLARGPDSHRRRHELGARRGRRCPHRGGENRRHDLVVGRQRQRAARQRFDGRERAQQPRANRRADDLEQRGRQVERRHRFHSRRADDPAPCGRGV